MNKHPFFTKINQDNHLIIDLKYSTTDNFTEQIVDGYQSDKCYLRHETAECLKRAIDFFKAEGLGIIIYDAYRPLRAIDFFQTWSMRLDLPNYHPIYYPNISRHSLFQKGFISKKSSHSRGVAVDLSLFDLKNNHLLDMGSIFDFFGDESATAYENLTVEQKSNRKLLLQMEQFGFKNYSKEWWHFQLSNESAANDYFDFTIS